MGRLKTTEQFIADARVIHGDKYDYSKVNYVNTKTKVLIVCPIHGEFWQTPDKHLNAKEGCPMCNKSFKSNRYKFIQKAREIHGDKYDYSRVEYINSQTKVLVVCPQHGEFWITPNNHLNGKGCKKCANEKLSLERRSSSEEFISKARKVHGDDYIYTEVNYVNNVTPVKIVCPKHGEFWQVPSYHLDGCGCPLCSNSALERDFRHLLVSENIKFIQSANKNDLPWIGQQHLDFYLPEYNVGIECQGRQHFNADDYFGGKDEFKVILERDQRKYNLCKENNVRLYYYTASNCMKYKDMYPYYKDNLYDDMQTILKEIRYTV